MRAVAGHVTSRRPTSPEMASSVVSRFAGFAAGAAASPDVAAHLRRSAAAFKELLQLHSELRVRDAKRRGDGERGDRSERSRQKMKKRRKAEHVLNSGVRDWNRIVEEAAKHRNEKVDDGSGSNSNGVAKEKERIDVEKLEKSDVRHVDAGKNMDFNAGKERKK